ncbi:MAG: HigA family addiction module antidote protein, partial [Steroidobacteraceae bacterium]|nr:HigA family addiction module antidote protein [Steroidobacteraceae bacterium]
MRLRDDEHKEQPCPEGQGRHAFCLHSIHDDPGYATPFPAKPPRSSANRGRIRRGVEPSDDVLCAPAQRIGEIVAGKRAITADTDLRLCRFFGLSDGWWLRLQADYDTEVAKTSLA